MNLEHDILVVDDEIPNLRLLTELLEKEGYQVRPVEKGQMAIDSALAKPPGLILLDVRLPEMDGFKVCRRLKEDKRTQHIPIIFVDVSQDIEARIQGFEAGGVDFITKPFQKPEVLARVRTHLRLHQMEQHLEQLVQKRTAEIAESEAKLRSLFENANETIVVTQDKAVKYCNPQISKLLGYTPEEIRTQSFVEFIHPEDREMVLREYQARLSGESPSGSYSTRIITKDGQVKHVSISSTLIDWEGEPASLGMIKDITVQMRTEEKLNRSEERFRKLMEESPLDIVIMNPRGQITEVNSAWMRHWGLDREETAVVLAKYNLRTDKQLEDCGFLPLVERAFAGESVVLPPIEYIGNLEVERMGLEGVELSSRWIQIHLYSVNDDKGDIEYVVGINTDITELKEAEREIREQRDALARVERATAMGQLTGSISHELNQPLTGILSNAQAAEIMIKKGKYEHGELLDIMSEIVADSKRAGDVIRNLRELYREQKGKFLPVDINAVVDEATRLLNSEFVAQHIVLTTECAPSIPIVNGNRVQIEQVLVNLIMNGIQAMSSTARDDRRLHISTAHDANEVKAWVQDHGSGIDADKIDRIFEPLATWKPGGTGMGLAISNSIIEAHGGRMWAENRPEGGARMGFALPILKEGQKA
jgi:PAS domain S-box-containing protein